MMIRAPSSYTHVRDAVQIIIFYHHHNQLYIWDSRLLHIFHLQDKYFCTATQIIIIIILQLSSSAYTLAFHTEYVLGPLSK